MILSLENVSYKYAVKPILSHVNFVVNEVEGVNEQLKENYEKGFALEYE